MNKHETSSQLERQADWPIHTVKPTGTLQFKAIVGTVLLVTVATGACAWITTHLGRSALTQVLHRDVRMLADTAARGLSDDLAAERRERLSRVVGEMTLDERVAFMIVADAAGHTQVRRIDDSDAWRAYKHTIPETDQLGAINLSKVINIERPRLPTLITYTQPVWHTPPDGGIAQLTGYVILAMSDPSSEQLLATQTFAALAVVCILSLLSLPLIVWVSRTWTRPLRQMAIRTTMLAEGRSTQPILTTQRDEVGMLAQAFNAMAKRISTMRTELIEANAELELQVRQRTEQLHQANEQLRGQMHEKDEFIRAITHDLNAPIRNIAGMTKMLLKKYEADLTEDAISKLHRIAANAKTESELLADLLELSRLRASEGKAGDIDLHQLITGIVESLEFDIEAKAIDVIVDKPLPVLHADRNRVRQVFQNLIDNAVKYMPTTSDRARKIHIGVTPNEQGRPVFFVLDTGRGIDPRDHQRVFQVFQRARYAGDAEVTGRGVGLASVKTIIETYGGRIWIESAPNQGTTFHFTFNNEVCPALATQDVENAPIDCVLINASD